MESTNPEVDILSVIFYAVVGVAEPEVEAELVVGL